MFSFLTNVKGASAESLQEKGSWKKWAANVSIYEEAKMSYYHSKIDDNYSEIKQAHIFAHEFKL